MLTENRRETTRIAYRARLHVFLQIPEDASDQRTHELIELGFHAKAVWGFCDAANLKPRERNQIVTLKTLKTRVERGQRLTAHESDRLYRFAHITAMAEAFFGDADKAVRWLTKPKERFSGKSPLSMLTSTVGTRQVEEMLFQLAEGFAF